MKLDEKDRLELEKQKLIYKEVIKRLDISRKKAKYRDLNISNLRLAGIKEYYSGDNKYLSILVKTNKFEGELKSSEEGEVNWYTLGEIEQRDDLSEHFMATLKLFTDDDLSELIVLSDQQSVTI